MTDSLQRGSRAFVRTSRESFPVTIVERSGNWILGLGKGQQESSIILEWFCIDARCCNVTPIHEEMPNMPAQNPA